ncbi:unnamed protein product [Linum tenue]|uniref:NADH dehydrogenase subunit 1 n=1 Tax=Linum tenue TaxID=586396 RepID=A0AAV0J0F6_9ROSI|nr:unnamed protein product [Linum tenue]
MLLLGDYLFVPLSFFQWRVVIIII